MSAELMRLAIKDVYKNDTWAAKVEAMDDNQVVAVYWDFYHRGLLEGLNTEVKKSRTRLEEVKDQSIIDAFDAAIEAGKYEQLKMDI